jgi:hypothetical protein
MAREMNSQKGCLAPPVEQRGQAALPDLFYLMTT